MQVRHAGGLLLAVVTEANPNVSQACWEAGRYPETLPAQSQVTQTPKVVIKFPAKALARPACAAYSLYSCLTQYARESLPVQSDASNRLPMVSIVATQPASMKLVAVFSTTIAGPASTLPTLSSLRR